MAGERLGGLFRPATVLGHQSQGAKFPCAVGLVESAKPATSPHLARPGCDQDNRAMEARGNPRADPDRRPTTSQRRACPLEHEKHHAKPDAAIETGTHLICRAGVNSYDALVECACAHLPIG